MINLILSYPWVVKYLFFNKLIACLISRTIKKEIVWQLAEGGRILEDGGLKFILRYACNCYELELAVKNINLLDGATIVESPVRTYRRGCPTLLNVIHSIADEPNASIINQYLKEKC